MWRDAYHSSDDDVRKELFDLSNALADFADRMRDDLFEISIIDDYQKKLSKVVPKTIKAYDKLSPEKQTLVAGRLFLFLISIRYVLIRHPLLVWTLAFHLKMMITAFVLWRSYNEHVKNFFDFSSYPSLRLATR
ncbi:hypothetical protein FACS189419_09960 [Planctomycetales bacterium]|nr:hypothetical protein FACS189419_09960 [Planctomycetales bacterium]